MRKVRLLLGIVIVLSSLIVLFTHAEAPKRLIVVDTLRMSLTLYENGIEILRFPIAAGAKDTPTPLGTFRIVRRFVPEEPNGFGTRFLGLNVPWGVYGIHGTSNPGSIGSHASHGCIRMYSRDAEKLYGLVPNGTPVIIESGPYGELGTHLPELQPGDRSAAVRAVQRKLRALGFYGGNPDGIWGYATTVALQGFLKEKGMTWEERVDQKMYAALGIMLFE